MIVPGRRRPAAPDCQHVEQPAAAQAGQFPGTCQGDPKKTSTRVAAADCNSTEASPPVSCSDVTDSETNSDPVRAPATVVLPRKKSV